MSFVTTLPGLFNSSFDPANGRKGRREHVLGPSFDPLGLGDDLLLWWDTEQGLNVTGSTVNSWTDRKTSAALQAAGTGNPTFDGTMVQITATAFLYGATAWTYEPPFEVWQIVDQTEAAGSDNSVSFACASGAGTVTLAYTPPIGGQSSAIVGSDTLFGGDNYHGMHVIRWIVKPDQVAGYLDRKLGLPANVSVPSGIPSAVYVGADNQGTHLWKGRLGDICVTKVLGDAEVAGMWAYLMKKAGM